MKTARHLAGLASDGGDIGANVQTLIGTSGTLYGEAGYNTDTGTSMWPFPNEDLIRTKMKAYNAGGASGNRGFCVDGTTLTKYIWQYLGNTIPAEIYGGSSDTTAPAAVTNLAATTGTNAGEVNLTWTAPGDDGSRHGFNVYHKMCCYSDHY